MADPEQTNSGVGIPAGTAKDGGSDDRPHIGNAGSGKRIREEAKRKKTDDLAPEAQGGAGAGRKWAGDS